jgi:hypothetical protein
MSLFVLQSSTTVDTNGPVTDFWYLLEVSISRLNFPSVLFALSLSKERLYSSPWNDEIDPDVSIMLLTCMLDNTLEIDH